MATPEQDAAYRALRAQVQKKYDDEQARLRAKLASVVPRPPKQRPTLTGKK